MEVEFIAFNPMDLEKFKRCREIIGKAHTLQHNFILRLSPKDRINGPKRILKTYNGRLASIELLRHILTASMTFEGVSPYLSPDIARLLCDLSRLNRLSIKIITSNEISNWHNDALNIFKQQQCEDIQVRRYTTEFPHEKLYIIDRSLLLTGSVNLTTQGLFRSLETMTVRNDPHVVQDSLLHFEGLWNKAETF